MSQCQNEWHLHIDELSLYAAVDIGVALRVPSATKTIDRGGLDPKWTPDCILSHDDADSCAAIRWTIASHTLGKRHIRRIPMNGFSYDFSQQNYKGVNSLPLKKSIQQDSFITVRADLEHSTLSFIVDGEDHGNVFFAEHFETQEIQLAELVPFISISGGDSRHLSISLITTNKPQ